MKTGIVRKVRLSNPSAAGDSATILVHTLERSSSSSSFATTWNLSVPTSTVTFGLALRLWYQGWMFWRSSVRGNDGQPTVRLGEMHQRHHPLPARSRADVMDQYERKVRHGPAHVTALGVELLDDPGVEDCRTQAVHDRASGDPVNEADAAIGQHVDVA
jgi:hypothetical protein